MSKRKTQAKFKGFTMKFDLGKTIKINLALTAFLLGSTAYVIANTATPSYARERECLGKFTVNGETTNWISMGEVGGFLKNKKKKCKEKTEKYSERNLTLKDFESANSEEMKQRVCELENIGGVEVYFDTQVEGKINSRDGTTRSMLNVTCDNVPSN
uniref:Uncharacterized protein n=1 Tax=Tolypothrix bouteillei VB521301 TaxID=1479485 RepID=A0A0C1N1P0_9CYAN